MSRILEQGLTFDDVLLLPAYSAVLPKDVLLDTRITAAIPTQMPLISAAMDTVTEAPMAIAMAQEGGLGVIHKNMLPAAQAEAVRQVKKYESWVVTDPVTVTPQTTVREILDLAKQHGFFGMPVVEGRQLVGLVTSRDVRFANELDQPVTQLMTPKPRLVTVNEGAEREEVLSLLHEHRIEKILVVNSAFELRGMITVRDILKAQEKPQANKDSAGRLRVGAAVGTNHSERERIQALVEAGVDVIFVDTAHGHSENVLAQVRYIRQTYPDVALSAGNIATAAAATALAEAGADAVKVGIGPGSICTTRIVTGIGVPQLTAIMQVAAALRNSPVTVIADGGIRFSGDISKALAAGADCVMIGSLFAGTDESPGEVELMHGRSYKTYRGMGSLGAMSAGSSDRYFQDQIASREKYVPEGVEGRVPYKGSMRSVLTQLLGGLRSAMGYTGCSTIAELQSKTEFVPISAAGNRESHVHDIQIAKMPPNYQLES